MVVEILPVPASVTAKSDSNTWPSVVVLTDPTTCSAAGGGRGVYRVGGGAAAPVY